MRAKVQRWWHFFGSALVLLVLWAPGAARAQSYYAFEAVLEPDGLRVGRLGNARIQIARWDSPTRPVIRFTGPTLTIEAPVDLAATGPGSTTQIVVTTERSIRISTASAFEITLRPGAHLPLLGQEAAQLRVALPPHMPASHGLIPSSGLGSPRGRPNSVAFHGPRMSRTATGLCEDLILLSAPNDSAERFTLALDAGHWVVVGAARDGFTEVQVESGPIALRGFVRGSVAMCDPTIGLTGIGSGCGDGRSGPTIVELPRGTDLYSSADAAQPFARTRRMVIGRAARDEVVPTSGPARWIISETGPQGRVSMSAYVRTPAASLRRAAASVSEGFGGCSTPISDWPRTRAAP